MGLELQYSAFPSDDPTFRDVVKNALAAGDDVEAVTAMIRVSYPNAAVSVQTHLAVVGVHSLKLYVFRDGSAFRGDDAS